MPEVGGLVAQLLEIVLGRPGEAGEPAAEIDRMGAVEQVIDPWMGLVLGPEHDLRLAPPVRLEDVQDGHHRDQETLGIAQADGIAGAQAARELLAHVEHHRDRPEGAVGEPHARQHGLVVGLAEKPLQRRKTAAQQQLQIAELALGQIPAGVGARLAPQGSGPVVRQIEDLERAPVRLDQ